MNYASFLLIREIKRSIGQSELVFDEGIPDAHFQEQQINVQTGVHSLMTPLFAPSQTIYSEMFNAPVEGGNQIRATADTLMFTLTQVGKPGKGISRNNILLIQS